MRVTGLRTLPTLIFTGFLAATIQPASAQSSTATSSYPQIVRLSYVEGDVRVSRGKLADKLDAKEDGRSTGWEQARIDLAIESGYSLVTGKGRAEIEFEDASTAYLADDSVLTFTNLTSTGGVPYTEIALLSGSATINVHTMPLGEAFRITTPTDSLVIRSPRHAVWRIDSYLDAVSITPQPDPSMPAVELTKYQADVTGKTATYMHGVRVLPAATRSATLPADWDAWVATRLAARTEAISATMKQANLATPIPGLADMNGKGRFFACEPYGTCWEPTSGWAGHIAEVSSTTETPVVAAQVVSPQQGTASTGPRPGAPATKATPQSAGDAYLAAHPGAILTTEDYLFPCSTFAVQDLLATDPVTGKQTIVDTYFDTDDGPFYWGPHFFPGYRGRGLGLFAGFDAWGYPYQPWEWAVCHAGSWIRWRHHYVWVAGTKRHHHRPVRWVQRGREIGFVPIHPRDVAGKPPVNLKDGVFKVTGKKDEPVQRVAYAEGAEYKLLDDPPKEFRKPSLQPLEMAAVPQAQAYSAFQLASASSAPLAGVNRPKGTAVTGAASTPQGTPIRFDPKSQTFSVARQVNQGGHSATFTQPLNARSTNYQGNASGFANQNRSASNSGYNNSAARSSSPSYNNNVSRQSSAVPSYNNSAAASRVSAPTPSFSAPAPAAAPASSSSAAHK